MTLCILVAGGQYRQRQAAIAERLDPLVASAVIFEGVDPDRVARPPESAPAPAVATVTISAATHTGFSSPTPARFPAASSNLLITSIAIGCPCCDGGMVMRVTLNRMLQRRPAQLFISLANATHLAHLQAYLATPDYAGIVTLAPPVTFGA